LNPIVKKILKILAWVVGSIIFLVILLLILIQIPAVQNFAKNKAVAYLQKKIGTKVSIDRLSIAFPKEVVLKGVYVEDQKKDTLLYGKELRVDIALLKLLSSQVNVNYLELNGIKTHIYRTNPDTTFNFDYIVKAFAGNDTTTKPKDTTGSGMKFDINRIVFKDILATFKDDVSGNDVYFYLGNFETKVKAFDPDKLEYKVKNINLSGIRAKVRQFTPLAVQKIDSTATAINNNVAVQSPIIQLDELGLQDVEFEYLNEVGAMQALIKIGDFIAHPKSINTQTLAINLDDLTLKNTTTAVVMGKPAKTIPTDTTSTAPSWDVMVKKLNLENEDISYNDNTQPHAKKGIDFAHLHIQGLNFNADSLQLTPTAYKGNIAQLAFKDTSGFALQKLQTNFYYSDTTAYLQNLYLQAGRTVLKDKIVVKYPSIKTISKNIGDLYIDADVKNSTIDMRDVLTFAPQLEANLKGNDKTLLHINTGIKGYVKNLSIPVFQLSGIGSTYIDLSGKIQGLPNANTAYYDINIAQFKTTSADIYSLVPAKTIPSNIRIPQAMSAKGYFKGNTKNIAAQLQLNTTNGNAFVKGNLQNNAYVADVTLTNLNVGYLTKQDSTIGRITLTAKAKGHDFDLKKAVADIQAKVQSAELKGYTYHNFDLTGSANAGIANVQANMLDSNLAFNLTANADITTQYPSNVKMQLQLDTANFNKLRLTPDTMMLRGLITADLPSANPDSLVGNISIAGVTLATPRLVISPDSMLITAAANGQQRSLVINSAFLKADLEGVYKFTEMGQAVEQTINQYYNIPGYRDTVYAAQDWQMNASLIPTPFILQLVSGAKGTDSVSLHADFNSMQRRLNAMVKTKRVIFNGTQADSVNVKLNTAADKLNYEASIQAARSGSISLHRTVVGGFVAQNKVDMSLDINDARDSVQYNIAGVLQQITDGIKFNLKTNGLILDYNKWTVAQDNYIQYDSTGLILNNFAISNSGQLMSLNSQSKTGSAPIDVKFNNFQISTLTHIVNQDSLLVGGDINGTAMVKNVTTSPVFTANLTIDSVTYKRDTIGTVAIKVNNEQANVYAANVTVNGKNTDIKLNGSYFTGESKMDLKLDINKLDLAAVKPFAVGQLDDAGGTMKANVSITGTTDKPDINGNINFINAYIVPTISGEKFTLSNEAINVDSRGIHFNNFTLLDSANNKAVVGGDILTSDFKNFKLNTTLNARDFTVVNAKQQPNRLFYGKLNITARLNVKGDMAAPAATGNITVNPVTDFTMVLPSTDPEIQEREGIVRFVDKDHPDTLAVKTIYDSLSTSSLRGLDVNANIQTDSAAKLTLVIDENTGDALTMQGVASLNGGIDRSGKISLTGSYALTHGAYTVSLSVLKKRFEIQPGSTITWTGDPTLAQVDINAIYYAKTAPIDLLEQQLTSQQDLTRFKQPLPFQVKLKLQGDLLKPAINFDIAMQQELLSIYPEVDLKLQQVRQDPSELNKQVFALLLLGRFVQQDPFASSGGTTTAGQLALQSAGRILTEQINNLASSLIKGVDINFDFNSSQDYSTGTQQTRTDVNVTVSKKLLNDRLIVNVGSDVGLQGAANNVTSVQNSSISGNFSLDYKLSRDGRYRLRAYRQNNYQEVIQGQVIETGVSFILVMDYDKFKELFEKRRRRRNNTLPALNTQESTKDKNNTKASSEQPKPEQGSSNNKTNNED